jgi:hypothetical protein
VHADEYEFIYQNMPTIGLGKAGVAAPVGRRGESARARIGIAAQGATTS